MPTQSIQYLLLSPTYTNVINVYAFCNTHDVTWGTKGDDKPDPLKKVTVSASGKTEEPSFNDADLDTLYASALEKFSSEAVEEPKKENPSEKELHYNKAFRSYVVLAWMFCNAALVAVVLKAGGLHRLSVTSTTGTDEDSPTIKIYLMIILWSVAGLSGFKFVGAMWYKIHRIVSSVWLQQRHLLIWTIVQKVRRVLGLVTNLIQHMCTNIMGDVGMRCQCRYQIILFMCLP
jgi:chitin synthase